MKRAQPQGSSRRRIQQLLSLIKPKSSAADRIESLSRHFLGLPYTTNPLVGSADDPEVFVFSLEGFDCVTYIETLLAFSRAATADDFVKELRNIRYADGRVDWRLRNHYMTGWIRNNTRDGLVRRVGRQAKQISKDRLLNVVPGLSATRSRFQCIPKKEIPRIADQLKTGDLIFFASTRPHLDIFHTGVIVRDGDRLLLRHASRSKGGVVEQELSDFLDANRMAGVVIVRPQDKE